jgi:iron complex outermembrane receptor protein
MKTTVSRRATIRALCGTGFVAAATVAAQDAPAPERITVEVTGSNIRRADAESALPVQVITREEIARSGSLSVAELLAKVSANVLGFNDQISIGNQIDGNRPGLSSVNLRALGDGATLILVNGRRVANYAFDGGTVDIGSIPLAAIERVEVLKDGASAIYGTDALAGVVNFILRKDVQGATLDATGSATEHKGGDRQRYAAIAGWGSLAKDRVNVFATVDYQKDGGLHALDRPFSRTSYIPEAGLTVTRPETFPANILRNRVAYNPSLASGCAPPLSVPVDSPAGRRCGFDATAASDSMPPVERTSSFGRATWQVSEDLQVFADGAYAENRLLLRIAPTPVNRAFTFDAEPVRYPANGLYYPTAFAAANGLSGALDLLYRTVPLGARTDLVDTHASRALVGAEGSAGGWDYATALVHSRTWQNDRFVSGWVSQRRLLDGLASGLINPFGPSGPEGDALLRAAQVTGDMHQAYGSTTLVDAKASRALRDLAGGPLAMAVGVEARREKLDNTANPLLNSGDLLTAGERGNLQGRRSAQAAYVELSVPFIKGVETQIAARYDHYSDFGGTTNPKVAVRWQPMRSLVLRASWGTGFRAPTLPDLDTPVSHVFTASGLGDPLRCPVTGTDEDCGGAFRAIFGGNPKLDPEKSTQYNAGLVWSPAPAVSMTVDYWNIRNRGVIGSLNEFDVFGNLDRYGTTNIVRGPVDPAFPNLPGPIETVVLVNENLGNLRTSGVDVDLAWRSSSSPLGLVAFRLNGTYVIDWRLRFGDVEIGGPGTSFNGAMPRWKHYAALDWTRGPWSATLAHNFQTGYTEPDFTQCGGDCGQRRVGDSSTWDAQLAYTGWRDVTLTAGVKNLFDRNPPVSYTGSGRFQVGYDPAYADPRGRAFSAGIKVTFK